MRVNKTNYQYNSNRVRFNGLGLPTGVVRTGEEMSSKIILKVKNRFLGETIIILRKYMAGLYNVKTNGEYVIKNGKVPYKLSTQTIIIPRGVKVVSGKYSATKKISVQGEISEGVKLKSKNIVIDEFANFSGTTKSICLNIYGRTTSASRHFTKELHIENGAHADGEFAVEGPAYIYGYVAHNAFIKAEGIYAGETAKVAGSLVTDGPANICAKLFHSAKVYVKSLIIHPGARIDKNANFIVQ